MWSLKMELITLTSLFLDPHVPLPALSTLMFSHFLSVKAVCLITHQQGLQMQKLPP